MNWGTIPKKSAPRPVPFKHFFRTSEARQLFWSYDLQTAHEISAPDGKYQVLEPCVRWRMSGATTSLKQLSSPHPNAPSNQGREGYSVLSPKELPKEWDQFVENHTRGSVFHLSDMANVYETVPGYRSQFIAAKCNHSDQILALLPSVRIETVRGLASRLASRTIWYSEPLLSESADPKVAQQALSDLIKIHDRQNSWSTLFTEVRPLLSPGSEREVLEKAGYQFLDYLNYVVNCDRSAEQHLASLSKSTRQKLRRSFKRGCEVELQNSHEGVRRMYPLVKSSYSRSRVPLAPIELFHAAVDQLPAEYLQIRIATYQGRDVGAGIGLTYKDRFYAWYGGSYRDLDVLPFYCLTWKEIEWCCQHKMLYDFGGAGWPDESYGPREFKKKFGGELCHFGRYRKTHSKARLMLAESGYAVLRRLFR